MRIGYARTSTTDQRAGFDAQIRELKEQGCSRVYREQISAVHDTRPELNAAIEALSTGDTLVVTRLDRLARSVVDLLEIVDRITATGATLQILAMGIDTSTATGRLILQVIGAIAEFERSMLLERQREGIAEAKRLGRYRGRAPKAKHRSKEILAAYTGGVSIAVLADTYDVAESTIYRVIRDERLRQKSDKAKPGKEAQT